MLVLTSDPRDGRAGLRHLGTHTVVTPQAGGAGTPAGHCQEQSSQTSELPRPAVLLTSHAGGSHMQTAHFPSTCQEVADQEAAH